MDGRISKQGLFSDLTSEICACVHAPDFEICVKRTLRCRQNGKLSRVRVESMVESRASPCRAELLTGVRFLFEYATHDLRSVLITLS